MVVCELRVSRHTGRASDGGLAGALCPHQGDRKERGKVLTDSSKRSALSSSYSGFVGRVDQAISPSLAHLILHVLTRLSVKTPALCFLYIYTHIDLYGRTLTFK